MYEVILKMFLYYLAFVFLIQNTKCNLPDFIQLCPGPDPNANDCLFTKAKYAFPYLVDGVPELGIPNNDKIPVDGSVVTLAPNAYVTLYGTIYPSKYSLYSARIDLTNKFWEIGISGTSVEHLYNFTIHIEEDSNTIDAKGKAVVETAAWGFLYTGYYDTVVIDGENYMQINDNNTKFTIDKYRNKFFDYTTMDGKKLIGTNLATVKQYLKNFKEHNGVKVRSNLASMISAIFNTILQLVPIENLFPTSA